MWELKHVLALACGTLHKTRVVTTHCIVYLYQSYAYMHGVIKFKSHLKLSAKPLQSHHRAFKLRLSHLKDTQDTRISAMVLGQDLKGGASYGQTVFIGLKNVSNRYPEPGTKVFQHFYPDINSEVINNFYGPVGPHARWAGYQKRGPRAKRVVRVHPLSYPPQIPQTLVN